MLAMQTKTPELALHPDEGAAFMAAAQNVMRHYSVETTQKTLDWIAFASCVGGMYGSRAMAIAARRGMEKREEGQVIPFRRNRAASPGFGPLQPAPGPVEAQAPGASNLPPDDSGYTPSVAPGDPDGDGF